MGHGMFHGMRPLGDRKGAVMPASWLIAFWAFIYPFGLLVLH